MDNDRDDKREEKAFELVEEWQEDRYHRTKESLEYALGIEITREQWNKAFNIVDEPYNSLRYLYDSREKLIDALKALKAFT